MPAKRIYSFAKDKFASRLPNNVTCDHCKRRFRLTPYKLQHDAHHFCTNACKIAHRTGTSTGQKTAHVTVHCDVCDKPLDRTINDANRYKHHFCSKEHLWTYKTTYAAIYYHRSLETSPKQKLVHFLVSHGVGVGEPQNAEMLLIAIKQGYFTPGLSPLQYPYETLADELEKRGHIGLARLLRDGTWEDESKWLCNTGHMIPRSIRRLPWEE